MQFHNKFTSKCNFVEFLWKFRRSYFVFVRKICKFSSNIHGIHSHLQRIEKISNHFIAVKIQYLLLNISENYGYNDNLYTLKNSQKIKQTKLRVIINFRLDAPRKYIFWNYFFWVIVYLDLQLTMKSCMRNSKTVESIITFVDAVVAIIHFTYLWSNTMQIPWDVIQKT